MRTIEDKIREHGEFSIAKEGDLHVVEVRWQKFSGRADSKFMRLSPDHLVELTATAVKHCSWRVKEAVNEIVSLFGDTQAVREVLSVHGFRHESQ